MFGKKRRAFEADKAHLIELIKNLDAKDFTITTSTEKGRVELFPPKNSGRDGITKGSVTMLTDGSKQYTLLMPPTSYEGYPDSEYDSLNDSEDCIACILTETEYNDFVNSVKGCDYIETTAYVMHIVLKNKDVITASRKLSRDATRMVYIEDQYYMERYSIPKILETKPYSVPDYSAVITRLKKYFTSRIKHAEYLTFI